MNGAVTLVSAVVILVGIAPASLISLVAGSVAVPGGNSGIDPAHRGEMGACSGTAVGAFCGAARAGAIFSDADHRNRLCSGRYAPAEHAYFR